ncbi:hypothetical protein HY625_00475 [Candidatus Uhrbacteria bacterium]|nr:hypothetical protein [Candidatus Uhrbacteria bacterium]
MKKIFVVAMLAALALPVFVYADTAGEVKEGQEIWEKISAKTVDCATLTDDQFERVGEFFMGRMAGNAHESMNTMMKQMLGSSGEEQMHVTMGKRMSGCETGVVSGTTWNGMMGGVLPMMSGWGGRNGMMQNWNQGSYTMMGGFSPWWMLGGFGVGLGAIVMLSFWVLLLILLVGLVRWVWRKGSQK